MNTVLNPLDTPVSISYALMNNKMTVIVNDNRAIVLDDANIVIETGESFGIPSIVSNGLNGVLMLKGFVEIIPCTPFVTHLDLHTTRNLYLSSSSLGSYNTISNFGNDMIIKKIPVRYNYNEMLFDSAEAGYDYLDVSKRLLTRIDFRLQDSFGKIINLNNNHWSFSLIFQVSE